MSAIDWVSFVLLSLGLVAFLISIVRWDLQERRAQRALRPRWNPVLSEEALAAFESTWGIRLPAEYREHLASVGNGRTPRDYGLEPLEDWCQPYEIDDCTPSRGCGDVASEHTAEETSRAGNILPAELQQAVRDAVAKATGRVR